MMTVLSVAKTKNLAKAEAVFLVVRDPSMNKL